MRMLSGRPALLIYPQPSSAIVFIVADKMCIDNEIAMDLNTGVELVLCRAHWQQCLLSLGPLVLSSTLRRDSPLCDAHPLTLTGNSPMIAEISEDDKLPH